MTRLWFLCLCLVLAQLNVGEASAKRIALVVGNDTYDNLPDLRKAVNDARAVKNALSAIGFKVILGENLNRRQANRKLAEFEASIEEGDEAFFFFAGHGVSLGPENYLIPQDMPMPRGGKSGLVRDEAHAVSALVERIQARGAKSTFVVLDACRDNPFSAKGVRSIGGKRGLTRIDAPSGVFVLYSAGIGQSALDRLSDADDNPNSVFTRKFVPLLSAPGLSHVGMAKQVQRDVAALAATVNHRQQPAYYDQIIGEIVLLPGETEQGPSLVRPPLNPASRAYQEIKNSKSVPVLEAFLEQFSSGVYAALVKQRLKRLREKDVAVGVQPVRPTVNSARSLRPGDTFRDCDSCPEMVILPAGSFLMGSPQRNKVQVAAERPQRKISFSKPFSVGKFEVTRAQFEVFASETGFRGGASCAGLTREGWQDIPGRDFRNPGPGHGQTETHPVTCISWQDARDYVSWLTRKTGRKYRLLSEAEWEYAARARSAKTYATGFTITSRKANFKPDARPNVNGSGPYRGGTVSVGSFAPNGFGLHDMAGNIAEWVDDCWFDNHRGASRDGRVRDRKHCTDRVVRGGSYSSNVWSMRSAFRTKGAADRRFDSFGIRVARALD